MSNRLESLSGKPAGAKALLKFKPKTNIARRSQEERAKDAPQVKAEPSNKNSSRKPPPKGKSGPRKQYAGTHMVSSGLLSTGSVPLGGSKVSQNTSYRNTLDGGSLNLPTPEFLQKVIAKSAANSSSNQEDEDFDVTRIDMGAEYRFDEEDTVLFPVRAPRNQAVDPIDVPSATPSAAPTATPEPSVKAEPTEDSIADLSKVKSEENAAIPSAAAAAPAQGLSFEESEDARLEVDQRHIKEFLEAKLDPTQQDTAQPASSPYFLFHLPQALPQYELEQETDVEMKTEPASDVEASQNGQNGQNGQTGQNGSESSQNQIHTGPYPPQGQIGSLNIHESGKITISLGNGIEMDVLGGMTANFLQEVAVLDISDNSGEPKSESTEAKDPEVEEVEEEKVHGELLRLGTVDGKLVVVPLL